MNKSDARLKAYISDILKKNKRLNELAVKAAVRRGLGVIGEVRRSLGIDRPRAIAYARTLLAKNPTLEAKKVIEDVGERFGISLAAPDVSRLRPEKKKVSGRLRRGRARKKKVATAKVRPQPKREGRRSIVAVSATHTAKGTPEEVARFFRSLVQ